MPNVKKAGIIALFTIVAASEVFAGSFANTSSYISGDVLVCFRKSGGGNDLVVDAGPVATLTNAAVNQRISITQYTTNQLYTIGLNSVIFSAFTWFDKSTMTQDNALLFMSRGRTSLFSQTAAWSQIPNVTQEANYDCGVLDMSSIVAGAVACRNYSGANSDTAVLEPDDSGTYPVSQNNNYTSGQSYIWTMNPSSLNFNGDFGDGTPEKTAPNNFVTGSTLVRSDFYMVPAQGNGSVKFFGYFELSTNGLMTYVAYPTTPTVTTLAATAIISTNAQLNATVNPNSDTATLFFQYGLTTAYGSSSVTTNLGTTSGTYGIAVSNLVAGTTYHFRAAAYNRAGTNFGSDLTFTTTGGGLTVPVITSFVRSNTTSYVSFTTGNSGTYTLRGTNGVSGLTTAHLNWPAINSVAGNGLTNTLQDITSISNKCYIITAQ